MFIMNQRKQEEWISEDQSVNYKGMSEKEMLESFWRVANYVDQFITFNGRNFDVPFLNASFRNAWC
jgi:3'-5' exonuclease